MFIYIKQEHKKLNYLIESLKLAKIFTGYKQI